MLQIGYAQEIITPSLNRPVYLAGFGRNRRATSVHDELSARALALVQGDLRLVVIALDLIGLDRLRCRRLEAALAHRVPGARALIACTHTHHGPDTLGLWGPDEATSGVDPAFMARLEERIIAAGLAALRHVQPAHLRSAGLQVPGIAKNARDPGVLDEELTCLQFVSPDGETPQATWLIYPCHPEVLWDENPHVTSDYIAALRDIVSQQTGAPAMASVGALGGMMTPDVVDHSFREAHDMGAHLAYAALAALHDEVAIDVTSAGYWRHEFAVPLENPLFRMAAALGLLPDRAAGGPNIETEASLLQLGPVLLLAVPGELLPGPGLSYKRALRAAGARHAAVIGLANDELGYILAREDFTPPVDYLDPGASYEESMSVGPAMEPRLTVAVGTLLRQLSTREAAVS